MTGISECFDEFAHFVVQFSTQHEPERRVFRHVLADKNDGSLEIRSSRRPGVLRLGRLGSIRVTYAHPEVFVPLWPLSDLVLQVP